jgi:hypothetical protein
MKSCKVEPCRWEALSSYCSFYQGEEIVSACRGDDGGRVA